MSDSESNKSDTAPEETNNSDSEGQYYSDASASSTSKSNQNEDSEENEEQSSDHYYQSYSEKNSDNSSGGEEQNEEQNEENDEEVSDSDEREYSEEEEETEKKAYKRRKLMRSKFCKNFSFPPTDYDKTIKIKSKFDEHQSLMIASIVNKWRNGLCSLFYSENSKFRNKVIVGSIIALHKNHKNVPPSLIVCSQKEAAKLSRMIHKYSKLIISVSSKNKFSRDLSDWVTEDLEKADDFNVFICTKKFFKKKLKYLPHEVAWSTVVVTKVGSKTKDTKKFCKIFEKISHFSCILCSSDLSNMKEQDIKNIFSLMKIKVPSSFTDQHIYISLSSSFVNSTDTDLPKLLGSIEGTKNPSVNPYYDASETNILCPMSEYEFSVYIHLLNKSKELLISGKYDAADLHDIASDLLSACHHPIIVDGVKAGNYIPSIPTNNHSAKMIVLANLIKSKEYAGERIVIITEDADSSVLVKFGLESYGIKTIVKGKINKKIPWEKIRDWQQTTNMPIVIDESNYKDAVTTITPTVLISYDSYCSLLMFRSKKKWTGLKRIRLLTAYATDFAFQSQILQYTNLTIEKILDEDTPKFRRLNAILRYCTAHLPDIKICSNDLKSPITTEQIILESAKMEYPKLDGDFSNNKEFWKQIFTIKPYSKILKTPKVPMAKYKGRVELRDDSFGSDSKRKEKSSDERQNDSESETEHETRSKKKKESEQIEDTYGSKNKDGFWNVHNVKEAVFHAMNFGMRDFDKVNITRYKREIQQIVQFCYYKLRSTGKVPAACKYIQELPGMKSIPISPEIVKEVEKMIGNRQMVYSFELASCVKDIVESKFTIYKKPSQTPLPPTSNWSYEDDIKLIKTVYDKGVINFGRDSEYKGSYDIKTYMVRLVLFIYRRIKKSYLGEIGVKEMRSMYKTLITYGYPNHQLFLNAVGNNYLDSKQSLHFLQSMLRFCTETDLNKRKEIAAAFPERFQKYQVTLVKQRLSDFERIRNLSKDITGTCAEDWEFFRALDKHGFSNSYVSPTLMICLNDNLSEIKLRQRLKSELLANNHSGKILFEYNGQNLERLLPIRLSAMIMLENLGKLTDYCDDIACFFDGYRVSVICPSLLSFEKLVFVTCRVEIREMKPKFIIECLEDKKRFFFEGDTPDSCWEMYRSEIEMKQETSCPQFDGYEMFGFTTPNYHKIVNCVLKEDKCKNYIRRTFKDLNYKFSRERIQIGHYASVEKVVEKKKINPGDAKFDFSYLTRGEEESSMVVLSNQSSCFNALIDLYSFDDELHVY